MIGPLTYLDAALIAVAFISGLLAMYRGFAREMLSIVSWLVAASAVLYFVLYHKPFAEEMAQQMGTQVAIAQIVVGALIFVIVLIVVHLITARLSDAILDSRIGSHLGIRCVGVWNEVLGDTESCGHGLSRDREIPRGVAESVLSNMQKPCDADSGSSQFAGPVGQAAKFCLRCQLWFQPSLEP